MGFLYRIFTRIFLCCYIQLVTAQYKFIKITTSLKKSWNHNVNRFVTLGPMTRQKSAEKAESNVRLRSAKFAIVARNPRLSSRKAQLAVSRFFFPSSSSTRFFIIRKKKQCLERTVERENAQRMERRVDDFRRFCVNARSYKSFLEAGVSGCEGAGRI